MLFLTSDCTFTSEPLVSGTKTTAPDVVSKFDPLITIVAFPDASLSIVAAVTVEPPSRVKLVMVGGLSIDFQSDPSELIPLLGDGLPDMASWSICAFGYKEYDVMMAAVAAGGHCRIGFENNMHLKDGQLAPDNAALIRQLATSVRPATREETVQIFAA